MSDVRWWGTWPIAEGGVLRWRVGPLSLAVERRAAEWRLGFESATDFLDASLSVAEASQGAALAALKTQERCVAPGKPDAVRLTPALADRPFVVRPEHPFVLTAGSSVELYVSSPLWVRVGVESPASELRDLPVFRPSDTWFGPTTTSGELAYAGRTHCRLRLADVPVRPHRAVTLVRLHNRASTAFQLQRLSVPVSALAVYAGPQGHLWTQGIELERDDAGDLSRLELHDGPPPAAGATERVAEARRPLQRGQLFRALDALF